MKLRGRRKLRTIALQVLYELDLMSKWEEHKKVLSEAFTRERIIQQEEKEFAVEIVNCVLKNRSSIDKIMNKFLKGWDIERLNVIERNILRIGICELLFLGNVPYKVAINEAVELSRTFAGEGAHRLINGVLDRIAREKGVTK